MAEYRVRARKQSPKKSNSKTPFGRFVFGSNDLSTKPVGEVYVFWLDKNFYRINDKKIKEYQNDYKDHMFLKNPVIYRSNYKKHKSSIERIRKYLQCMLQ